MKRRIEYVQLELDFTIKFKSGMNVKVMGKDLLWKWDWSGQIGIVESFWGFEGTYSVYFPQFSHPIGKDVPCILSFEPDQLERIPGKRMPYWKRKNKK